MPSTASSVSLDALLSAYALLEVGWQASGADVRRAYRELARRHHPDRVPPNSPEHVLATARMAAINAAYELIHDAPRRHHPISRGSDHHRTFTDADVREAQRLARAHQRREQIVTAVTIAGLCILVSLVALPTLHRAGVGYAASAAVIIALAAWAYAVRRSVDPFVALNGLAALLRLLFVR